MFGTIGTQVCTDARQLHPGSCWAPANSDALTVRVEHALQSCRILLTRLEAGAHGRAANCLVHRCFCTSIIQLCVSIIGLFVCHHAHACLQEDAEVVLVIPDKFAGTMELVPLDRRTLVRVIDVKRCYFWSLLQHPWSADCECICDPSLLQPGCRLQVAQKNVHKCACVCIASQDESTCIIS